MLRKLRAFIFINLCLVSVSLWVIPVLEGSTEEAVKLIVGETRVISIRSPTRVVIGNPGVADIADVTSSEITVSAKSPGTTTLVYWDAFGEQSIDIRVIQEDMNEIKRRVDNLLEKLNLGGVYARAEDDEGKVLLLGRVKSAQEKERITVALGPLKDKIIDLIEVKEEEAAVEIDVQVLELDKDATNTLGFTWPGSITLTDSSGPTPTAVTGLQRVFHVSQFTRSAFNVTLDTLIQEGKARVLSRPRLACQSGKEAQLLVGGEKPIFTTSIASTVGTASTNVEYKEFGIKLNIKPTVTEEKDIKLALNVEVSEVGTAEFIGSTTNRTAQAYPLTKRNASTELFLRDGQTMAIGGLIKQKNEEDIRKTAWLGDIPILGAAFRKKTTKVGGGTGERGNVELFITLTPTIVSKEIPDSKAVSSQKIPSKEIESPQIQTSRIPLDLANYARAIQAKIFGASYYPRQARDAGWEGKLRLSLNIASNGNLNDIKILESSGYKILDDAALDVARTQAPYPPFPPQIKSGDVWVDVPIVYKKDN